MACRPPGTKVVPSHHSWMAPGPTNLSVTWPGSVVGQFDKEASQTRDYCVAKNATQRAARLDPSPRKRRLFRMTIKLTHYPRIPFLYTGSPDNYTNRSPFFLDVAPASEPSQSVRIKTG